MPKLTATDARFETFMEGWLIAPDAACSTHGFAYLEILEVTGANGLTVKGDLTGMLSGDERFWIFAPPHVSAQTGAIRGTFTGSTFKPAKCDSRYLWAQYRYMPPMAGYEVNPGTPGIYGRQPGTNQTGTYHAWNRQYDPGTGRWTTPDPAANHPNLFDYLDSRSLQATDPTGLEPLSASAIALKCVLGAIMSAAVDYAMQHLSDAWGWVSGWCRGDTSKAQWKDTDWCSVILSALIGCVVAPVAAKWIEPWVTDKLKVLGIGGAVGAAGASLMSKVILFVAKKAAVGIPKSATNFLLKLNCITEEEAEQLERAGEVETPAASNKDTSSRSSGTATPSSPTGGKSTSQPSDASGWFDPKKVAGPMTYDWCMESCRKSNSSPYTKEALESRCAASCAAYK